MKILDALLVLKEQAVNGCVDKPLYGICYNLAVMTEDYDYPYSFVMKHSQDWEHFSGCLADPVVLSDDCDLWEGEQLELRLSLIDHLINKAKQQRV